MLYFKVVKFQSIEKQEKAYTKKLNQKKKYKAKKWKNIEKTDLLKYLFPHVDYHIKIKNKQKYGENIYKILPKLQYPQKMYKCCLKLFIGKKIMNQTD